MTSAPTTMFVLDFKAKYGYVMNKNEKEIMDKLKSTPNVTWPFKNLPTCFTENIGFLYMVLSINTYVLEHVAPKMIDGDLIAYALALNPLCISVVPDKYLTTETIMQSIRISNGIAFYRIPRECRTLELAMFAVECLRDKDSIETKRLIHKFCRDAPNFYNLRQIFMPDEFYESKDCMNEAREQLAVKTLITKKTPNLNKSVNVSFSFM